MGKFRRLLLAGAAVVVLLQVVRPGIPVKPATAELRTTPEVQRILEKSCYSCHSDQRRLSWFDQIVPAYWVVRHHILTAREHLNFSTLGAKSAAQKATLYESVNMIRLGAMPLPAFLLLHPEAKVTPEELATLKAYLAPWTSEPRAPANAPAEIPSSVNLATVQPEFDGFPFDPTFESWKLISTTDRGDNGTFRFVLGNDVSARAARTGSLSPWPDGARLAKIAWQQEPGPDGLVRPGKFVQVELMVKDAGRYKRTQGWGWGRWRGVDLKPYGKDAHFVDECTGCHQPLGGNDYVYTLPISPAKVSRAEVVNHAAALPASLPYQPLDWGAITMYVDPMDRTMATLYGNERAIEAARARTAKGPAYTSGAVLALVTWTQRDDPHWFGARIPGVPQSVEFVEAGQPPSYRRFSGAGLTEVRDAAGAAQRASFVLGLAPAWLP
ncbi:MAG TPA: cytochrome P460 family protein [Bryobacteraceae bacterium]|nr:cytochrome P460 family protein [Bryobacteraceae bacterium]